MKKNNKSNMMDQSVYNEMLKHRKKELRKRLKNDDEVLPKGAIPIPPPNWNAPPEKIQLLSSSPINNQYGYYNTRHMNTIKSYFPPSPPSSQMNIDTLYNKKEDDDDYNFDGTEIFDSIDSNKTTPLNSVTSSPLLTPVDEDESKLIPIINNNNLSLEDNLTGNPFDKELINRIKNSTSKKKIKIKNKRKSTRKSKKSSQKPPSPLKLPDYKGGYKNKSKRTSKKSFKKYNRKKSSKKHVKK